MLQGKPAAPLCQQLCHRQGGGLEGGDKLDLLHSLLPQGFQRLPGAVEPGGQIVGRHPQGAALLPGVKKQGGALQRLHMEVQALPVRDGLGERKLPPLLQDGVRFVVPVQERVVDDVVDVAGGQAVDVCLDLLAVGRFTIRRSGAAVTDGSTGIGMGPVRVPAGGRRRRHMSGSAHGDLAADAIETAADAGTTVGHRQRSPYRR